MQQRRTASSNNPHHPQDKKQTMIPTNHGAIRKGGSTAASATASNGGSPDPAAQTPNRTNFPRRRRPKLSQHSQQQLQRRQDSSSCRWLLQRLRLRQCLGWCFVLLMLCVSCVYLGFYLALHYAINLTGAGRLRRNHHDIAAATAQLPVVRSQSVPDHPNINQREILDTRVQLRGDPSAAAGAAASVGGVELLQRRPSKTIVEPRHLLSAAELAQPEQIVDMRQLNYELPFDNPDGGAWKQGWDLQPAAPTDGENTKLQVFVIPHSHCDPGWIKTFDEYFRQRTSNIITTVIQALVQDARRTFIWAEISYFAWWWEEQNEVTRGMVQELLRTGQFEFVTGGWVQPDEANAERYAMEIQLQEGHDWIRQHVGAQYIPQYGWAIDPETAAEVDRLFSQLQQTLADLQS